MLTLKDQKRSLLRMGGKRMAVTTSMGPAPDCARASPPMKLSMLCHAGLAPALTVSTWRTVTRLSATSHHTCAKHDDAATAAWPEWNITIESILKYPRLRHAGVLRIAGIKSGKTAPIMILCQLGGQYRCSKPSPPLQQP